jgi:hypothetical protein
MTAEPLPEPDLDTLARHVLPGKIDAVAYGLSVLHADVRAIRLTQGEHGLMLSDHGEMLARHGLRLDSIDATLRQHSEALGAAGERLGAIEAKLDGHGELLAEILRRLPEKPEA